MKKILFSALAMLATLSISAQTLKVYKYNADGTVSSTPDYTTTDKVKVVFESASSDPQAGDNVEGTTTINGTTYTKAVGGTVADYVDLGMKDSNGKAVLWATHNLGATKPEEYGAYIAWGENGTAEEGYVDGIKLKDGSSYYYWDNLKYCSGTTDVGPFTKYVDSSSFGTVDNLTTLESEDDAATVNWGSDWRTPTYDEWTALNNTDNFTWAWDSTNNGYTVTSKISGYVGKSVFLPAAGYRYSSYLGGAGSFGLYWSSSLFTSYSGYARDCYFFSGNHYVDGNYGYYRRYAGRSVRPVRSQN